MSAADAELHLEKENLTKKEERSVCFQVYITPATEKHLQHFCQKQCTKGNFLTIGDLLGNLADQFAKSKTCKS